MENQLQEKLQEAPRSKSVNTTFVERNNLTLIQQNGRLQRKILKFSKEKTLCNCQMDFFLGVYHFIRPHGGLKRLRNRKKRKGTV
ncbi:MAG: hypothetical protein ACFFD2_18045 [Promethearchaeota archaeon]